MSEERLLDLESSAGAKSADEEEEEALQKSKAQSICSRPNPPPVYSVAALGWFRAQKLYNHYWLNHVLQQSKPKNQNAISLSSKKKIFFTELLQEMPGPEPDSEFAKNVCLALLLDLSNIDAIFGSSRVFLRFVAKCCSSPTSAEKAVVQKQMLRYCVSMGENLVLDFFCKAFCLETIAVHHDLTVILPFEKVEPRVLPMLVDSAFQSAVHAATQYAIFTRNELWNEEETEAQKLANGKVFARRYRELFELAKALQKNETVDPLVLSFFRQFKRQYMECIQIP